MKDIVDNKAYGKVTSFVNVLEFQKRGLPHTHQLYTLADDDKPRNPDDIDKIVCAEIPDKKKNKKLHDLVQTHMVHGPCGVQNPESPCMEVINGVRQCSKGYPKPLQDETNISKNGVVNYRRRKISDDQRLSVWCKDRRKYIPLDNGWIVPYNPALLLKYKVRNSYHSA